VSEVAAAEEIAASEMAGPDGGMISGADSGLDAEDEVVLALVGKFDCGDTLNAGLPSPSLLLKKKALTKMRCSGTAAEARLPPPGLAWTN